MSERKSKKAKPRLTLSAEPQRRKLACVVVVLTIGAVAFESDLLSILNPAGSVENDGQGTDDFSELDSMLAEFSDPDDQRDTLRSQRESDAQLADSQETTPLLIPTFDTATEVPARSVSFPQQSSSGSSSTRPYGRHSAYSDRNPAATGIRFTGGIQPIQ